MPFGIACVSHLWFVISESHVCELAVTFKVEPQLLFKRITVCGVALNSVFLDFFASVFISDCPNHTSQVTKSQGRNWRNEASPTIKITYLLFKAFQSNSVDCNQQEFCHPLINMETVLSLWCIFNVFKLEVTQCHILILSLCLLFRVVIATVCGKYCGKAQLFKGGQINKQDLKCKNCYHQWTNSPSVLSDYL